MEEYVNRKPRLSEDFSLFPVLLAYCVASGSFSGKCQLIYGTWESPTAHAAYVYVDEWKREGNGTNMLCRTSPWYLFLFRKQLSVH
jgi:hypothetical protein